MKKLLRYSFVALLMTVCNVAFAEDITFDFDNNYATLFPTLTGVSSNDVNDGDFTEATTSAEVSGATVTVSASTTNTPNRIWSSSPRLRMYRGTFTITAPAGKDITAIKFVSGKFDAGNTVNTETLTRNSDSSAEWVGQSNEVVLNIAKNTQLKSLTLTVVQSGTEAPAEIKIEGTTPFYGSTTVTLSSNKETYQFYYTTDGTNPETSATAIEYNKVPFTISETCTVKVFDEVNNVSAEKEFVKNDIQKVNNIAAFKALAENTIAELTLTDAVVLGHGKNNTVLKDATGAILVYYLGQEVSQGQKLNGTLMATRVVYGGVDEAKVEKGFTVDVTATDGTITPIAATPSDILGKEILTEVYKLTDVAVKKNTDSNRFYLMNGSEEVIQLYDEFGVSDMISADGTYTFEAIRGKYESNGVANEQLWITKVGEGEEPQKDEVVKVANIAAFKALPANTVAELTLTNAKVVYTFTTTNNNTSTYVRDNSGAVMFYNSAKELAKDEDVNGTIIVVRSEHNSNVQAIANDQTNLNDLIHVAGTPAQPKTITMAQVGENDNDLVTIANVSVTKEDKNYYAVSGEDKVQLYNKYHIEAYEAGFDAFVGTGDYTITGIIEAYKTSFELCPIEEGVVTGINEVKVETSAANAIYNLAGQKVSDTYKGIVIENGRKVVRK